MRLAARRRQYQGGPLGTRAGMVNPAAGPWTLNVGTGSFGTLPLQARGSRRTSRRVERRQYVAPAIAQLAAWQMRPGNG